MELDKIIFDGKISRFVLSLTKTELEELLKDGRMEDQYWDDFDYDELEELYKGVR